MKHVVEEVVLKTGARGLIVDVPGASVMSSQFHFRAGSRFVREKDIYETAHIMEHMAFGANKDFADSHAYEAEFTRNGAYHNAYTSDYSMVYVSECADFEWDRVLDLKKVAIVNPRFNDEELEAEKGNVRSELTGYLNNYNRLLWPRLGLEMGEDIMTYRNRLKTIADIKLADIKEHYKRTHTSHNMRFVVAGNISERKRQLLAQLESWDLSPGERLPIPVDQLHGTDAIVIKRKESSDITFGLSFVIPRRISDDELDAMGALNHILSGTMHSRILGAARKKGMAYHMFSDSSAYEHNSGWDFGAQITLANINTFFDIMISQVKDVIKNGLTDDEVELAKSYALGKHQMSLQTVGQINGLYADRYFFDGVIENYDRRPEEIKSVTKEQIVRVAREFISSNLWTIGFVGNIERAEANALRERIQSELVA